MKSLVFASAVITLAAAPLASAQTAVQVPGREIESALQRTAEQAESDQPLRILNIAGQYSLGISIVHRARTGGRLIAPAAEHSAVTEIFHFIAGTGTVVTGGSLDAPQSATQDPLSGPTVLGTKIVNGMARAVGPGDVIVIPPNTPVQFTDVNSAELVYLVVRVDPANFVAAAQTPP